MSSDLMSSHERRLAQPPLQSTLRARREGFWQITFPVLVVALIFIGLVVGLFFWKGTVGVSIVADLSLMVVILPTCAVGLLITGLIAGIAFGVSWASKNVWPYTNTAQRGMNLTYRTVNKVTDQFTGFMIGGLAMMSGFANVLDKWMGTNGDTTPQGAADPTSTQTTPGGSSGQA
jgi:hypothetical protein